MKFVRTLLVAAVCAASASSALAADLVVESPAVPVDDAVFNWTGLYAGLGVKGSSLSDGVNTDTTGYINLEVGANAQIDSIVLGVEGWVGGYAISAGGSGVAGGLEARAGYLLTESVLLYGTVGGIVYDAGANYGSIGAGLEFAVTDNMSIDVDYEYWGWSNNGYTGHVFGASALWHF